MSKALIGATWLDRRRERSLVADLLFIALLALASPATAKALSLNEALAAAYDNNPQLAAARAAQRKVDEGVPQALALRRPTVTGQAGVGATNGAATASGGSNGTQTETRVGPVGAVALNVPLWTAGRADAAITGANARIEAGLDSFRATEQDVLLRAAAAYADVLRAQNVMDVNRKHEQELDAELAAAKRRFGAGELRGTDVSATEAQAALGRARVTQSEGDLDLARQIFRGTVGLEPDHLQSPHLPPGLPARREESVDAAADSPAVAAASHTVDAARAALTSARAQLRPSLAATGSVGYPVSSGELVLSIPLLDGGLAESQSRGAKQELEQRRLELDGQRITARQDAVTAWDSLQTARAGIGADEAQVQAAQRTRDGLAREAAQGLRTQLDVLASEQHLLDAELALAGARRDELVGAYRLLAATGHLSAQELGLPVEPYDAGRYAAATGAPLWDPAEVGHAYRDLRP
jgi:outer membrane protein